MSCDVSCDAQQERTAVRRHRNIRCFTLPQGQPLSSFFTATADFTDALFTVDFGRHADPGLFKDSPCGEPVTARTSLSLQRVVDECEECLGEGPLDFRIVQEKIALSSDFSGNL